MTDIVLKSEYMSVTDLSQILCVPQTIIVEWIEHEVVCAEVKENIYYVAACDIARAKSAMRLTHDLGINASGIAVILNLREKIKQLEALLNQS